MADGQLIYVEKVVDEVVPFNQKHIRAEEQDQVFRVSLVIDFTLHPHGFDQPQLRNCLAWLNLVHPFFHASPCRIKHVYIASPKHIFSFLNGVVDLGGRVTDGRVFVRLVEALHFRKEAFNQHDSDVKEVIWIFLLLHLLTEFRRNSATTERNQWLGIPVCLLHRDQHLFVQFLNHRLNWLFPEHSTIILLPILGQITEAILLRQ